MRKLIVLLLAAALYLAGCAAPATIPPNGMVVTYTPTPTATATNTPCATADYVVSGQNLIGPWVSNIHVDQTTGCPEPTSTREPTATEKVPTESLMWNYSCDETPGYVTVWAEALPYDGFYWVFLQPQGGSAISLGFKEDGQVMAWSSLHLPSQAGGFYVWAAQGATEFEAFDAFYDNDYLKSDWFWIYCVYQTATPTPSATSSPTFTPRPTRTPTATAILANGQVINAGCGVNINGNNNTVYTRCGSDQTTNNTVVQATVTQTPTPTRTLAPLDPYATVVATFTPCPPTPQPDCNCE